MIHFLKWVDSVKKHVLTSAGCIKQILITSLIFQVDDLLKEVQKLREELRGKDALISKLTQQLVHEYIFYSSNK